MSNKFNKMSSKGLIQAHYNLVVYTAHHRDLVAAKFTTLKSKEKKFLLK